MSVQKNKIPKSFIPPVAVSVAAKEGLRLRRQFRRGGTMVGVARARDLKNRRPTSFRTILRMVSFFARHAVDKRSSRWGSEVKPSTGYIAWLLWGGDAGNTWAQSIKRKFRPKKVIFYDSAYLIDKKFFHKNRGTRERY